MDYIDRYVYAVTKNLPKTQREDIDKEIRAMIDDMVEQNNDENTYEAKVKNVLLELGDPETLADNYRDSKKYLIGPKFYNRYIEILKIVLVVVLCVSAFVLAISIAFGEGSVSDRISDYFSVLFSMLFQGFLWTTIAFVIVERNDMNSNKKMGKEEWNPGRLPAVPEKKAVISPLGPIISIIVSTGIITLIISMPEVFAAYFTGENGMTVIPLFNLNTIKDFTVLFGLLYLFGILKEVLKLILKRWSLKLSIPFSILSIISLVLVLIIFTSSSIWNPDFAGQLFQQASLAIDTDTINLNALLEKVKTVFIIVLIVAYLIEIAEAMYKGVRYDK